MVWFTQGALFFLMIASLVALIDGIIEYRRSPYLAWRQEVERRIRELENEEEE